MPPKKKLKEEDEEEERRKALALAKKNGMIAFKKKQFEWASKWYTDAIELDENDPMLFSMRSQCYYNVGRFDQSLADAKSIIQLRPRSGKGYYRKALAHAKMEHFALAYRTVVKGLDADPAYKLLHSTKRDIGTALASGRWTNPLATAMCFTYYDDGGENIVEKDVPRESSDGSAAEVIGCMADVNSFIQVCRDRKMDLHGAYYEKLKDGSLHMYKDHLRRFFDQDPVRSFYYLYYSGRSVADTGDWCICKPRLGLKDVLDMWEISAGSSANSRLVIIADCSFSGAWARALAEDPTYASVRCVAVQAACSARERAVATKDGGVFTQMWTANASLSSRREIVTVYGQPIRNKGQQAIEDGTFAEGQTGRPVLLMAAWIEQLNALLSLEQTPICYAKWAMANEVVIHCGRRLVAFNVESAKQIQKLHQLDIGVDEGEVDPERCHVS